MTEKDTTTTDAAAMASSLATVQTAVAGFDKIAAGVAALHDAFPVDLVADASTKDGMQTLKNGYNAWRGPRLELERKRKEAKAPVVSLGRHIDAFAGKLEDQLRIGENHYGGQIEAYKAEQARKAEEARLAEEARKEKHVKALAVIRSYAAMATGLPSARIANGIAKLEAMRFGAEWEEYASQAVIAQTETLVQLRTMLDQAKAAEAARIQQEEEARQRELERQENERKAAELKAAADALEAKAAELARREQEFDALREAVQQTEPAAADDDKGMAFSVSEAQADAARATLGFKLADTPASMLTPTELSIARQTGQIDVAPLRAEALAAAEERTTQRPQTARKGPEEPTVKLGDINALMGDGFAMTEAFVTKTLGIVKPTPPAGSRGVLFLPSQVYEILTALAERALSSRP